MDWKIIIFSFIIAGFLSIICYQIFRLKINKLKLNHQEKILEMRQNHEMEMIKLRHDQEKENKLTVNKNTIITTNTK